MNRNLETRLTRLEVAAEPPKKALPVCFSFNQREDEARQAYIKQHGFEPKKVIVFRVIEPLSNGDL